MWQNRYARVDNKDKQFLYFSSPTSEPVAIVALEVRHNMLCPKYCSPQTSCLTIFIFALVCMLRAASWSAQTDWWALSEADKAALEDDCAEAVLELAFAHSGPPRDSDGSPSGGVALDGDDRSFVASGGSRSRRSRMSSGTGRSLSTTSASSQRSQRQLVPRLFSSAILLLLLLLSWRILAKTESFARGIRRRPMGPLAFSAC